MSEPFIGEIRMVGFNFAPRGWALCNGQLLSIAQNSALFSLLGTTYGGNGQTNFALPDLQGRVPMHWGNGAGLTPRTIGESSGTESVTLINSQMPAHTHTAAYNPATNPALAVNVGVVNAQATAQAPAGNMLAQPEVPSRTAPTAVNAYAAPVTPTGSLAGVTVTGTGAVTVGLAGGSQPFPILQPFLCVSFVIALEGIFPSRN